MLILRAKVASNAVILFSLTMELRRLRILGFYRSFLQNEINEIKMTENGISFVEDESKTQIKNPSIIELDNLTIFLILCAFFF